tara:strand:- start:170 stop:1345 length:1176 start_codon:yes stop_codon:yes gene_type:complete
MFKLNKIIIISLTLFLNSISLNANEIKVFYSGFSFSNLYESNKSQTKFTSELIKEIDPDTNVNIISSKLLKKVRNSSFNQIDLDSENLLDFSKYPDNAIVMSVALQHEEFTQELNYNTNVYSGFYDAYFQILFFDFSDKNLIASIPFDFEIQMLSESEFDKKQVLKLVREFYLDDDPFMDLDRTINQFQIKRKYASRIGITDVSIQEKAFEEMPANAKDLKNSYKNLVAQTFSKRLSQNHNVAIVPYMEGQAIGRSMKLRFVQADDIYSITLPNPDYHINLNLKGFKKVLAKSSDVEELYYYGSFFDIKIFQPDLNKVYFNEALRGITKIKIPKGQSGVNDWRKYYYNMEILFDNFSKNITKPDKKWLKDVSKNKIKKQIKDLEPLLKTLK